MFGFLSQPFWPCGCRVKVVLLKLWRGWCDKKAPMSRSQTSITGSLVPKSWVTFKQEKMNQLTHVKWNHLIKMLSNVSKHRVKASEMPRHRYVYIENSPPKYLWGHPNPDKTSPDVADVGQRCCPCWRDAGSTADLLASASRALVPWRGDRPVPEFLGDIFGDILAYMKQDETPASP